MAGLLTETSQEYYEGNTGSYRYISILDIVNNFMVAYVGDDKLIQYVRRSDVIFHAKRGIQELSYDVSRVKKIQEIELGSTLTMAMPQDFVSLVELSYVDENGIEHPLHESRLTSAPSEVPLQDDDNEFLYDGDGDLLEGNSLTTERFKGFDYQRGIAGSLNIGDDYVYNDFDTVRTVTLGGRYGLNPETTQKNGVYVIDEENGTISFSSGLVNKVILIKYISDGLATEAEMKVHKFEEDALYSYINWAILNTKVGVQEYIVRRYQKQKSIAMRNAKIRLMKLNIKELTQVMRNKGKAIK